MTYESKHSSNATADGGRFVSLEPLGNGLWRGERRHPTRREVIFAFRSSLRRTDELDELLQYDVPGLAPLFFIGPPDGYKCPDWRRLQGGELVVIEARPEGAHLLEAGRLSRNEIVRLGLGLCDTILAWSVQARITGGLRPETVYVVGSPGKRRFAGAIPRSFFILGNSERCAAFSHEPYDPPIGAYFADLAVDDEVFVVALLLWFALLGEHAYAVPGHPSLDNNMWDDIRLPFTGPSELGRLLEAVLVADADRRMKAGEFREELARLAHAWNVDLPPFPPPGLAEPNSH